MEVSTVGRKWATKVLPNEIALCIPSSVPAAAHGHADHPASTGKTFAQSIIPIYATGRTGLIDGRDFKWLGSKRV